MGCENGTKTQAEIWLEMGMSDRLQQVMDVVNNEITPELRKELEQKGFASFLNENGDWTWELTEKYVTGGYRLNCLVKDAAHRNMILLSYCIVLKTRLDELIKFSACRHCYP